MRFETREPVLVEARASPPCGLGAPCEGVAGELQFGHSSSSVSDERRFWDWTIFSGKHKVSICLGQSRNSGSETRRASWALVPRCFCVFSGQFNRPKVAVILPVPEHRGPEIFRGFQVQFFGQVSFPSSFSTGWFPIVFNHCSFQEPGVSPGFLVVS